MKALISILLALFLLPFSAFAYNGMFEKSRVLESLRASGTAIYCSQSELDYYINDAAVEASKELQKKVVIESMIPVARVASTTGVCVLLKVVN